MNKYDIDKQIEMLREREKELKCLYKVQEIVASDLPVDEFLMQIIKHIWGGWQHPVITRVRILIEDKEYREPDWELTEWMQYSDIIVDEHVVGRIEIYYTQFRRMVSDSPFLPEEQKLLNTIARHIGNYIYNLRLKRTLEVLEKEGQPNENDDGNNPLLLPVESDMHWIWRNEFAHKMADHLDFKRFGVQGFYLIGSAKNATAGPASDIDILIHFTGDDMQLKGLRCWCEGWSLCLSEFNFMRTGYKTKGLIDLHIVTDEDIRLKTSYAAMIGSLENSARLIKSR